MKKWLISLILIGLIHNPIAFILSEKSGQLELEGQSAILIDATSGTVLYHKEASKKLPPASLAKIMTVYLAFHQGELDAILTVSEEALHEVDRATSHIWLDVKEEVRLEEMGYAAMLTSANDAALVLAHGIGQSQEVFVAEMNQMAANAGAKNTHFVNATGMVSEEQYTTVYDIAMITRMAMQDTDFSRVFGAVRFEVSPTNKMQEGRVFLTDHEMMKSGKNDYPSVTGGKAAWQEGTGYMLVTSAKQGDLELIAVVMGNETKQGQYDDTKKLLDYGFENYKTMVLTAQDTEPYYYELKKGKQVVATATFTMIHDFKILLKKDYIEELIKITYEVRHTEPAAEMECWAILMMNQEKVGEQKMQGEITVTDTSFKAMWLPRIMIVIDGISAITCIGFMGLFVYALFFKRKVKTE